MTIFSKFGVSTWKVVKKDFEIPISMKPVSLNIFLAKNRKIKCRPCIAIDKTVSEKWCLVKLKKLDKFESDKNFEIIIWN